MPLAPDKSLGSSHLEEKKVSLGMRTGSPMKESTKQERRSREVTIQPGKRLHTFSPTEEQSTDHSSGLTSYRYC